MTIEVFTADELAKLLKVSKDKTYQRIREVKSVSDELGLRGRITANDLQTWIDYRRKLQERQ